MKRRGFLQAMLAAAAAPAIVKAETLMKIMVPKQELILPKQFGRGMTSVIAHIDEFPYLGMDFDGDVISATHFAPQEGALFIHPEDNHLYLRHNGQWQDKGKFQISKIRI